jgi:hypothetical protein
MGDIHIPTALTQPTICAFPMEGLSRLSGLTAAVHTTALQSMNVQDMAAIAMPTVDAADTTANIHDWHSSGISSDISSGIHSGVSRGIWLWHQQWYPQWVQQWQLAQQGYQQLVGQWCHLDYKSVPPQTPPLPPRTPNLCQL